MSETDVLVIGAGVSGLLCASQLQDAGLKVRVVDKGRGPGGRISTRRQADARFDHGAQFFTVRDARFQAFVDQWMQAGVVREWFRHSPEDSNPQGYPRYCGMEGMASVPRYLATQLDVACGERITELSRNIDVWIATSASGARLAAPYLLLSTPLPQALALLDTSGLDYAGNDKAALRRIRYAKALTTMAILDGPSALPQTGFVKLLQKPLAWIADNKLKGISPHATAVTIHSDAEFAEQHWGSPDETCGPLMLEAAEQWLGSPVREYCCHRWGFTTPLNPWHEKHYTNPAIKLTLAGDAFGGARVEGAALSGIEAAEAILHR